MIERSNTNVALDRIFDEVYDMMNEAKRIPFSDKIMLDETDLVNVLDDLKEAIPREIKSATQVLEEQKTIVNNAYADAERIVQQAKDEAERIIAAANAEAEAKLQQEEIVQQANAFAAEVKSNALRYQQETKSAADEYSLNNKRMSLQYADDMMAYLCQEMQKSLDILHENRECISAEMQNVENNVGHDKAVEATNEQESAEQEQQAEK